MAASLEAQYLIYRGNALPAIVETLAEQLHVSAEALDALGVGWKIDENAWVFPERDDTGEIVGLSRRMWDGKKFAVAGSKRGLSFVPYPVEDGYCRERQTWEQVTDYAPCPICGKPNWCGVDASHDPPRFARCMRVDEGAVHHDAGDPQGHIHELVPGAFKPPSKLASPLGPSPHPILIVEGPTDVAAALSLGFEAVGKPSNTGGIAALLKLVHGRPVAIIGENDRKADGTWPGKTGMEKTFEAVRGVCPSAVKVLPPADAKDLRNWRYQYGLTTDGLLDAIAAGDTSTDDKVLESNAPLLLATRWIEQMKTEHGHISLRSWRRGWYEYNGHEYREVDEDSDIRGALYHWLKDKTYKHYGAKGDVTLKPIVPTRHMVSDVIDALNAICPVPDQPPCWLDNRQAPALTDVVVFQNGILDTEAFLAGRPDFLSPSTPQLFHLSAVPYFFDKNAVCPGWLKFLGEVFQSDTEKIALLQEWFGYNLVPDTSLEKFMLMVGRPGSGKSTVLEVLEAMLGKHQYAKSSFSDLCSDFGRQPLIGKLAIVLPDAHVPKRADKIQALEVIKSIVGRDGVSVNRKYQSYLTDVRLPGRITIAVNDLPDLTDHARALERRLLAVYFPESFEGREDTTLKDRLPMEAPGIAMWALKGLRRLRKAGRFTMPKASEPLMDEIRQALTPVAEFLGDCCDQDVEAWVPIQQLYDCWLAWCRARGLHPGVQSRFSRRLTHQLPNLTRGKRTVVGNQVRTVNGLTLTDAAKKEYLH